MARVTVMNQQPSDGWAPNEDRRRMINRALTLRASGGLAEILDEARGEWNGRHARHVIRGEGNLRDKYRFLLSREVILPDSVLQDLDDFKSIPDSHIVYERRGWAQPIEVIDDWFQLVGLVSRTIWPEADFPNWSASKREHPGDRYTSACLIYNESRIDPNQHVAAWGYWIQQTEVAPDRIEESYEYRRLKLEYKSLVEEIRATIDLSDEELDALVRRSRSRAHLSSDAPRFFLDGAGDPKRGFWFVPINPWIRSADWNKTSPKIAKWLEERGDPLTERVHELLAEGLTNEEIALRLGVTGQFVSGLKKLD